MASNYTSKGRVNNEKRVDDKGTEKVAQTVDYQSSAGQGQEVKKKGVEVIHQCHPSGEQAGAVGRGVVGSAANVVAHTAQAAKDAVSGHTKDS